jgi:hypothetical protein
MLREFAANPVGTERFGWQEKKRPVGDWGAMKDQGLIRVLGV